MGYQSALEAAGAIVHAFAEFGDYQGTWLAKVTWNGETGFVAGSYGSCSGCDAFEAEFGWGWDDDEEEEEAYHQRVADFGKEYLETILPASHYIKIYESDSWYAGEGMVEWLKENSKEN